MAYTLSLREPLEDTLREAGLQQINQALKELRSKNVASTQIHQSRKAFKRFRALLHLIRPGLGKSAFRRLEGGIRDIARAFGDARDSHVMVETVAKLEALAPAHAGAAFVPALKAGLQERLQQNGGMTPGAWRPQVRALERLALDFKSVPIAISDFADFEPGLRQVYSDCRARLDHALATNDEEDFHDCRKVVQRHWRHMQLFRRVWPEAMRPRINLAHDLAQILGEDHDVAVLKRYISTHGAQLGAKASGEAFLRLCSAHQQTLRGRAKLLSQRLFFLKPRVFFGLMEVYWRTAQEALDLEVKDMIVAKSANIVRIA